MNKFGITVYPLNDGSPLMGKFVLLKESAMSKAKSPLFLRQVTDVRIGNILYTIVPYKSKSNPDQTQGNWHRDQIEGWISNEDAQKVMTWERLTNED